MTKETNAFGIAAVHLRRTFQEEGCPLCRRVRESEERWIWQVLYEMTGDPATHERFSRALGLCQGHAALLVQVVESRELVTPSSVARLYETVVHSLLQDLPRPSRGVCPLCETAEEVTDRESWFLGRLLLDPEFWGAFQRSDGLCLPHFLRVYALAPEKIRPSLLSDFQERLSSLLRHLRELQRKERFDVEERPTEEEARSWREALWRLAGMSFPATLIKCGY
mgnify:CR=1 FL=1|jgi:hypothetical protein